MFSRGMKVKEIFYSLQGEGRFTGTAAVFLRLSGCNLKCPFCDTDHFDGTLMSHEDIMDELVKYPSRHLVITGGEPSLQLEPSFIDMLHEYGYFVQVETNGTHPLPQNVDWITCSPKSKNIVYDRVNELKVVFGSDAVGGNSLLEHLSTSVEAEEYYLQPCDTGDKVVNVEILGRCVEYIKNNPVWRLSLQTHKLIDIP